MNDVSKEFVKNALAKGDYSLYPKSDSCTAEWWSTFDRTRDKEGNTVAFVQCRHCLSLFAYSPRKIGTSSLSTHAKSCRTTQPNSNHNIITIFSGPTTSNVFGEMEHLITEAVAEMCAKDTRRFEIVAGSGFKYSVTSDEREKITLMLNLFYLIQLLFRDIFSRWQEVRYFRLKSLLFTLIAFE